MSEVLSPEEEQVLRNVYSRHVKYHKWREWYHNAERKGRQHIGNNFTLLPGDTRNMRHELWMAMNRLYWEAMEAEARGFGCRLELGQPELEKDRDKIYLVANETSR